MLSSLFPLVSNFDESVDFPQKAPKGKTSALDTGSERHRTKGYKEGTGKGKGQTARDEAENEKDTGEESKGRDRKRENQQTVNEQIPSPENL